MKLNLGCGKDIIPGFENWDRAIDLEKPLLFPDKTIELVYLKNVIEHILNHKQLLKEIFRILQDDGVLFLTTSNYCSLGHRLAFAFGKDYAFRDYNHVRFFSYDMILEELREAGFVINKVENNSQTLPLSVNPRFAGNVKIWAGK